MISQDETRSEPTAPDRLPDCPGCQSGGPLISSHLPDCFSNPLREPHGCREAHNDPRVCAAAHPLHQVHVSWEHGAISSDPAECYQCHVFTRVVLEALDSHEPAAT